jgi:NRPS condensation-like uncharacterized protein
VPQVPLNLLDEHFLNLDQEREPWGVHIEVRVSGRLDAELLAEAIGAAVRRHPLARVKLMRSRPLDLAYRWDVDDAPDRMPLTVTECPDDRSLAVVRESLFAMSPPLRVAPPFRVVLAHRPGGDAILVNLHHAAGDGVSAVRLMRSILRAYAGVDDPVPALDPLAVRDVLQLARARSLEEGAARWTAMASEAARRLAPVARVARQGGDRRPGYGFELMALSSDETGAVLAKRDDDNGATVNDVLLAALTIAIRRWNAGHGRATGRVSLTMPVNMRPDSWREEVVGNYAAYVTVSLAPGEHEDVRSALEETVDRTRQIKESRLAGVTVMLLVGPSMLPVAAKRRLQDLIPLTGNTVVDTASLSNLGVLDGWPDLGDLSGTVEAVWFSPPGRAPLGAALGIGTVGGRLHIAMRYPHSQFDRAGARAFGALYREVLVA